MGRMGGTGGSPILPVLPVLPVTGRRVRRHEGAEPARHDRERRDCRAADDHAVAMVERDRACAAARRALGATASNSGGPGCSGAGRRPRRGQRPWRTRSAAATAAESACQAVSGGQGGADARLHLDRRGERVFDQVRVAFARGRREGAHCAGHRPPSRFAHRGLEASVRRRCRRRFHGDRAANRSSGTRRRQDVAHHDGRDRHGGEHTCAGRICRRAGMAQGDSMRHITGLAASLILFGATAATAATSELADAAMRGDRAAVRAALARKTDVNAPQVDGTTALHWAVERDDVELAELLLTSGARVDARTREGVMPLQLAAINGSVPMLGRLIRSGADPNAPLTPAGDTALMLAARTGKTDAVRLLLEARADVNAKESWGGTTALMWAVAEGHA